MALAAYVHMNKEQAQQFDVRRKRINELLWMLARSLS